MTKYLLFSLIVIGTSCASVKVKQQYDQKIDFSKYKTWCWLKGCELVYQGPGHLYNDQTIENIGNAIAVEMFNKGFQQVDDQADLLLDFHIYVKQDSALMSRVHTTENYPYWQDYEEDYYHFYKGTLTIDIVDKSLSRVIWQGVAIKYMSLYPDVSDQDIKDGIAKTLKKFPPENE